ncbi:helix-turn-helix domain-containing protein [Shouchella clausii]|uniref:helix-turn-helix domain-containing protein n=1 Tax=Shouchella clausii TaxID=79880 RepID=UPI00289DDFBC|nr:helix-turn-helix transcriptional regulator [Shouchella clausii]
MGFSERLKLLREKNGLDRQKLADELHLSYSTLSKYETNQRKADYETLILIADYFQVTVDYLIGRVEVPTQSLDKDQWLFSLSDDELDHLKDELDKYRKLKAQFLGQSEKR